MRIRSITYELCADVPMHFNHEIPTITVRGALGYALAQMLTWEDGIGFRDKIMLYLNLFNPSCSGLNNGERSSPPFVLRGNFASSSRDSFLLEVVLFGSAVEHEAFWDKWIELTAIRGLGKYGETCQCRKIHSRPILPEFPAVNEIVIDFQTPTRLNAQKRPWLDEIPFWVLTARLYDRLAELYHDFAPQENLEDMLLMPAQELKSAAWEIFSEKISGGRYQARRISGRTGDEMYLNGFCGQMYYEGDFSPFAPLLAYLPWTGVGKSCIFGCGWGVLRFKSGVNQQMEQIG